MRRCLKLLRCSGDAARPVGVTTPRGLLLTHPLATSLRSGSGKPLPVESKAGAMPTDNGSWRYQNCHKLFWVGLRKLWPRWKDPLILVTPRTVVGWHRAGFRLYWKWLSRARPTRGRKRVSQEIRALIFQMVAENPTWGAPRIHGELLMLGFTVSEPTVSRWIRRAPRTHDPGKRWLTFLRNHREAIAAVVSSPCQR